MASERTQNQGPFRVTETVTSDGDIVEQRVELREESPAAQVLGDAGLRPLARLLLGGE